jgi:hypothetical protein
MFDGFLISLHISWLEKISQDPKRICLALEMLMEDFAS